MSMRYFTLSAVCMLIFCMLLALSGTTDFPDSRREFVSTSGSALTAPGLPHPGTGEVMASVVHLPEDSELDAREGIPREARQEGAACSRPLLFLGVFFVAAWVLLSFKLFVESRG